jgi:hypothetical protein
VAITNQPTFNRFLHIPEKPAEARGAVSKPPTKERYRRGSEAARMEGDIRRAAIVDCVKGEPPKERKAQKS